MEHICWLVDGSQRTCVALYADWVEAVWLILIRKVFAAATR